MDMYQSLPLSAMNIPYFFRPFRTACACGGKPDTSKSLRKRNRSPMRGRRSSVSLLAWWVAG